jgi:hypothetical protein
LKQFVITTNSLSIDDFRDMLGVRKVVEIPKDEFYGHSSELPNEPNDGRMWFTSGRHIWHLSYPTGRMDS